MSKGRRASFWSLKSTERYYKNIIYAAGTFITITIITSLLVVVWSHFSNFMEVQRSLFQRQYALAGYELEQYLNFTEKPPNNCKAFPYMQDPDSGLQFLAKYQRELRVNQGIVTTDSGFSDTKFYLASTLIHKKDTEKLCELLETVKDASTLTAYRHINSTDILETLVYSPDFTFYAFSPAQLRQEDKSRIKRVGVRDYISARNQLLESRLRAAMLQSFSANSRSLFWIPLEPDRFIDQPSVAFSIPVFQDGRRIAVIALRIRAEKFFKFLFKNTPAPGFSLVSPDRHYLYSHEKKTHAGATEQYKWLAMLRHDSNFSYHPDDANNTDNKTRFFRFGTTFFFIQTIEGTTWRLVYAFNGRYIISIFHDELLLAAYTFLLLCGFLWIGIFFIDFRILRPLQQRSRQLLASEAFNRTIVDAAPVGLVVFHADTQEIIAQNEQATALINPPEEAHHFYKNFIADYRNMPNHENTEILERQFISHATGIVRDIDISCARANYQGDNVFLLGLTDISHRKAAERLLINAKMAAEQANQAKMFFLAAISHEIRTPLHGALGNLELLDMSRLDPDQKERMKVIRSSFDALLSLVNDILDFSKIEAQELHLNPVSTNIVELVEQCALTFAPMIVKKGIRFYCFNDSRLISEVRVDHHRLKQVLMNLLSNANKFTEKGFIEFSVEPVTSSGSTLLRFQVADSGIGIAAERIPYIFDPFVQEDNSIYHHYGGSGLGLSLCDRLIKLMHGHIEVESKTGIGSIFSFAIPVEFISEPAPAYSADHVLDKTIYLYCVEPRWFASLIQRFKTWGARVIEVESSQLDHVSHAPEKEAIFVAASSFDDFPEAAYLGHFSRAIFLSPRGPLKPQAKYGGIYLTSFSTRALQDALSLEQPIQYATTQETALTTVLQKHRPSLAILIAEDDAVSRALLRDQLSKLGYQNVTAVEDGAYALQLWRQHHFDVILTDLGMQKIDGRALLDAIRAEQSAVPIIATTAAGAQELHGSISSFSGVLHKPVGIDALEAVLNAVLSTSAQNQPPPLPRSDAQKIIVVPNVVKAAFIDSWATERHAIASAFAQTDWTLAVRKLHKTLGALRAIKNDELAVPCEQLHHTVAQEKAVTPRSIAASSDFLIQVDAAVEQLRREL